MGCVIIDVVVFFETPMNRREAMSIRLKNVWECHKIQIKIKLKYNYMWEEEGMWNKPK